MALPYAVWRRIPRPIYALASRLNGRWAEIEGFMATHQLGLFETLARIRAERLSLARLGDGELALALRSESYITYQQGSPALQADLRDILSGRGYEDTRLLAAIPGLTVPYYRLYWAKYWPLVRPLLSDKMIYGNISVSREALFRADPEAGRLAWRQVWQGERVCFVTGKGSRFEPIPAFFDNTLEQRFIYSLPAQAYADLPRLMDEIRAEIPRDTLLLLSLGPAATVLAARLAREGYWAIDLGHITAAWRTITAGAPRAEHMPVQNSD